MRELTAVALSSELGVAASGAADGAVLLHTCHNGCLLRSISHPASQPIAHLHVSAVHCRVAFGSAHPGATELYVHALSGARLHTLHAQGGVRCSLLTPDGALLVLGGGSGHLAAWRVDDGQLACLFEPTAAGVSCATVSANELLVGTQEGEIVGYAFDPAVAYPRVDGRSVRDSAGWAQGRVQ